MRLRGLLGLVLFALVALTVADAPAQTAETRVALIIANEAYASPDLGRLPGTQRDAAVMRQALATAGFVVTVRSNLSRAEMRSELSAFASRLRQLGQGGVGFLYFSGHGIADGPRGQNYLIPVDAQVGDVTDLPTHGIAMNEELDAIELAGARATIVVIDACRNTVVAIGRSGARGLAPVPVRTDTLLAFSTQPGATAADDGAYAQALAQELVQPGADAVNVFARVTSLVATRTLRRQVPRYDNGLIEPVVFVADTAPPESQSLSPATRLAMQPPSALSPTPLNGTFVGRWISQGESRRCSQNVEIISLPPNMLVREWNGERPPRRAMPYSTIHASDTVIVAEFAEGATSFNLQGSRLQISYRLKGECTYTRAPS